MRRKHKSGRLCCWRSRPLSAISYREDIKNCGLTRAEISIEIGQSTGWGSIAIFRNSYQKAQEKRRFFRFFSFGRKKGVFGLDQQSTWFQRIVKRSNWIFWDVVCEKYITFKKRAQKKTLFNFNCWKNRAELLSTEVQFPVHKLWNLPQSFSCAFKDYLLKE